MSNDKLSNKTCIPCQGGVPILTPDEVDQYSGQIDSSWQVTHSHTRLLKSVKTKDFSNAMTLAQKIGAMADEQWHHPELTIGFGHLEIEVWTHKINGLVESDFIFASKVDKIISEESSLIN